MSVIVYKKWCIDWRSRELQGSHGLLMGVYEVVEESEVLQTEWNTVSVAIFGSKNACFRKMPRCSQSNLGVRETSTLAKTTLV